ncbi:calcium binding egf domain-containing protein, partial [Cystoisospora suis]
MGGSESKSGCSDSGNNYCASLPNARACVSIPDSPDFQCACKEGFRSSGRNINATCNDVDECAETPRICDTQIARSQCVNTPGSYKCVCNEYRELKGESCEPIDACAKNRGGCAENSDCINNTDAPPTCKCREGYTGNDGKPGQPCK